MVNKFSHVIFLGGIPMKELHVVFFELIGFSHPTNTSYDNDISYF